MVGDLRMWLGRATPGNPRKMRSVADHLHRAPGPPGRSILSSASASGRISIAAKAFGAAPDPDRLEEIRQLCERADRVQLHYGTDHVIADGAVFTSRMTDLPFDDWRFENLGAGVNPKKEKPSKPGVDGRPVFDVTKIAATGDDSLFTWVAARWGSTAPTTADEWLTCDDGADEIADFVHISFTAQPKVTLIHVKGSGSDSPNRRISASDYEVVAAQALKNLRSLELHALSDTLEQHADREAAAFTLHNGASSDRAAMVARCRAHSGPYARHVVILQPRVLESAYNTARASLTAGGRDRNALNARRLDTLLHATRAECLKLGAVFEVYSAK